MNQRGQTIIEALIMLPIISILIFIGIGAGALGYTHMILSESLTDATYCLAEGWSETKCKQITKSELKQRLPYGEIEYLHLLSMEHAYRAQIKFKLGSNRIWKIIKSKKITAIEIAQASRLF